MTKIRVTSLNYPVLVQVNRNHAVGLPCLYCWDVMLKPTWDHVIPISKGGPNNRGNLVVVCQVCNVDKGNLDLPAFEGMLKAIGSDRGKKVEAFRQWVVRGWSYEDKAVYERLVADSWAATMRERVKDQPARAYSDVGAALSRLLKSEFVNRRRTA